MVLVDTSVWIDHFRNGNEQLKQLLNHGKVIWTLDKRLNNIAKLFDLNYN